jgi:peptidyl-dipeptidase Dcp
MAEIGMPKEIVLRHPSTAFGHIFSGDGYSAGYYVYIWADAMTADVYEGFQEKGGLYNKDACKLLVARRETTNPTSDDIPQHRRQQWRRWLTKKGRNDRNHPFGEWAIGKQEFNARAHTAEHRACLHGRGAPV